MLKAEDLRVDQQEILGWPVKITSYKLGGRFHCHIANTDPGATIVRTEADTYNEAFREAVAKAHERLTSKTRY